MSEQVLTIAISALASVMVAAIGAVGSFKAMERQRMRDQAETNKIDGEAGAVFQEMATKCGSQLRKLQDEMTVMQEQMGKLKEQLKAQEEYTAQIEHGLEVLMHQLRAMGATPVWEPPKSKLAKDKDFKD